MARRRRSKFAIDFNQEPEVVVRKVFADLMRKHPRGATGKLTSRDYPYSRNPVGITKETAQREGVGIYCGYTEDQIFDLFIKEGSPGRTLGFGNLIEYHWIREQYPNKTEEELEDWGYAYVPEATVTRRKNRIMDRIRSVKNEIEHRGRPGVYRINTGWRTALTDVNFYVWANSRNEAEGQFNTLTKPLIAAVDPKFTMEHNVSIEQTQFDVEPSELLESTQKTIDGMNNLELRLQKQIAELTDQLEGLRGIKTMVSDMAVNSIVADSV